MIKPSLELARKALEYARGKRRSGSGNLRTLGLGGDKSRLLAENRIERQQKAEKLLIEFRQTHRYEFSQEGGGDRLRSIAKELAAAGIGDCTELSVLAFAYLAGKKVRPLMLVDVEEPGDHTFVVLGLADKKTIDKPLEEWGDGVFVCDPWANIACQARHYHIDWQCRMMLWALKGKQVYFPNADPSPPDGFIDPLHEDWYSSIVRYPLVVQYELLK